MDLSPQSLTLHDAGRVELALARRLGLSRRVTSTWLRQGRVTGPGGRLQKGDRLAANSAVELHLPGQLGQWVPTAEPGLPLLAAGDGWLALDKPAGMPSHLSMPFEQGCALNHLVSHDTGVVDCGDDPLQGGLVHRLDNDASGILLAATRPSAWTTLRQYFSRGLVRRVYRARVAAVDGAWPKGSGTISERLIARGAKVHLSNVGRETQSHWRVLDARGLLEVELVTGHRHQIRVHLASRGWPLVGDVLYGGPAADRLMLQCIRIQLPDNGPDLQLPLAGYVT